MAGRLDFPGGFDLGPAVRARLERDPVQSRRVRFRMPLVRLRVLRTPPAVLRPAWQAATAAVLALSVLLSGVLVASPGARHAVAGWFGLRGVRIVVTPPPSTTPPERPLGAGLDLGRRTTLQEAERHLGNPLLLPAGLGPPDEVYVRDLSLTGGIAFLVYRPRPGLPESTATGVGLLLGEFTGDVSRPGLEKFVFGSTGTTLETVTVNGSVGYWIEHGHAVAYLDRNGQTVPDDLRLAGNVLLWEQGRLTLRLESALSKSESLVLARTIS